jgi:hypothetical protein
VIVITVAHVHLMIADRSMRNDKLHKRDHRPAWWG